VAGGDDVSIKDAQTRFHEEWLGLAQPIEGLVFSVPVLADAQIAPVVGTDLSARFEEQLVRVPNPTNKKYQLIPDQPVRVQQLRRLFAEFLGYDGAGMLVERDQLPKELHFYAEEGRQDIRPSFAIARGPLQPASDDPFADFADTPAPMPTPASDGQSPYLALVWDLTDDGAPLGLALDKPEDTTGTWRYPPTAKFERLLRHSGIPIGLLGNARELRLVYAPPTESTSHLTFRFADMAEPSGRPVLAAFELLLGARRTYEAAETFTLEGLLRESRRRQADVTKDLAAQVFEAVEILLAGYESAALREGGKQSTEWLRAALAAPHDHFYQGVLSVVLRLVFLLYAEDQGLMPVAHPTYAQHMSVQGLYYDLVEDAGMHPESMHHRFGAYGRLLSLFRAVFLGVKHGDLELPPRQGRLFDPSSYPFLEGGLPGSTAPINQPEARAQLRPPALDDGIIHAVLERLVLFEGQRLSYRALDVEQIGSVYESLMGYHVKRMTSPAVRFGKNGVWIELAQLRAQKGGDRKKHLKEFCGLSPAQIGKIEAALDEHAKDDAVAEALSTGKKGLDRERNRVGADRLVLQPGEERRRSGSHYTPRSLTQRIVQRTLEPILACLGPEPTEQQILSLKVCDPAMGSGAFLVETCRHLADQIIAAWTRDGSLAAMIEQHGDAHLHARRLVAQRCLYGVDKNDAAVELAKLSLWLVTMGRELPFTFVDHALRHGDSLVGLDLEQIASFHWTTSKQIPLFDASIRDALDQALAYRREIHQLAQFEDGVSQREKRRLLDHADNATERIRLVADACVGAFFAEGKDKAREAERVRRMDVVSRWLKGDEELEPEVKGMAEAIREQHAPFHWWLEFPEVFYEERPDPLDGGKVNGAACMEAFVGNPPFMGVPSMNAAYGANWVAWLWSNYPGEKGNRGNVDMIVFFLLRAYRLLGPHGCLGLVATNTLSQGDSRVAGLKVILTNGATIYDAMPSMAWPGAAAVTISTVCVARGRAASSVDVRLADQPVRAINSRLLPKPERPDAVPLRNNDRLAFLGAKPYGQGFVIEPHEKDTLVAADSRNAERIFPFLGGQEVNTSPTQAHDRYVISFGSMPLHEAERWPDLTDILRTRVKPERDKLGGYSVADARRESWWQFGTVTPALDAAISNEIRCIVTARVTKHLCFSFQPTGQIFNEKLYVFALSSFAAFAMLQSRVHEAWTWLLSSTLETRLNYSASDCVDTFPFPRPDPRTVIPEVEVAGQTFYEARAKFMIDTDQGLTKTYNALKDPDNSDPAILELRRLTEAMDRAVLDAYGWTDLDVPPYCPKTPAELEAHKAFEDEVIDRLYVLNAERAREEARAGLGKQSGKQAKRGKKKNTAQLGIEGVD
jgi:hypothetical protein